MVNYVMNIITHQKFNALFISICIRLSLHEYKLLYFDLVSLLFL